MWIHNLTSNTRAHAYANYYSQYLYLNDSYSTNYNPYHYRPALSIFMLRLKNYTTLCIV